MKVYKINSAPFMMNSEDDILNILKYLNLNFMYTNKILKYPSINHQNIYVAIQFITFWHMDSPPFH